MNAAPVAPLDIPSTADIAHSAEFAVVGALVQVAGRVQDEVLSIVKDDDFADPRCRFTIGVIREMRAANMPADQLTICGFVQRNGRLKGAPRVTLSVWLSEITSAAPCLASVGYYAELLVEEAARRAAKQAAAAIADAADDGSLVDLLSIVADELAAVTMAVERVGGGVHA